MEKYNHSLHSRSRLFSEESESVLHSPGTYTLGIFRYSGRVRQLESCLCRHLELGTFDLADVLGSGAAAISVKTTNINKCQALQKDLLEEGFTVALLNR